MPINKVEKIWMNGKLINWDEAKIHVLSHVLHYGSSWFEGIRCYQTKNGSAIFRLEPHLKRLSDSVKMYRGEIPYTQQQLSNAIIETIKANNLKQCYIRPLVYRGYGEMGVNPLGCPIEIVIVTWEWGKYLGKEAIEKGVDVCVSSWTRLAPNTIPTMAKAGANYMNSQLIKMEALADGYAEGIALDSNGHISEGSGENIFVIKNNIIYTPPISDALLPGITRSTVMQFANDANFTIVEQHIPREMLYVADEVFFTGTASEITPIRSIDKMIIGEGKPGPITRELQKRFFDVVTEGNDPHQWLTFL